MSVSIAYQGRFGNHMCQYVAGRLLAEETGRILVTRPSSSMSQILGVAPTPGNCNKIYSGDPIVITDIHNGKEHYAKDGYEVVAKAIKDHGNTERPIRLHGYFSDKAVLMDCSKFFNVPKVDVNTKDLCIHVRMIDYADYRGGVIVSPEYYLNQIKEIMADEGFDQLHIVSDEWSHDYYKHFDEWKPEVHVGGTPAEDFHFMRQFRQLIIGNSSFAWWAAYLGHAHFPRAFAGWCGGPHPCNLAYHPKFHPVEGDYWEGQVGFKAAWEKADKAPGWFEISEARAAYECAKKLPPHASILQVGAQQGRATVLLANTNRNVVVIDDFPLGPVPGSDAGRVITDEDRKTFRENIKEYEGKVHWIDKPLGEVLYDISSPWFYMAYIDVFHDEGRALRTYEHIKPYLAPGAWVLWHDYQVCYPSVIDAVDALVAKGEIEKVKVVRTVAVTKRCAMDEIQRDSADEADRQKIETKDTEPEAPRAYSAGSHTIHEYLPAKSEDDPAWTFLTMSKGRNHHLERSLPSMLKQDNCEVLLIDYDCPDNASQLGLKLAVGVNHARLKCIQFHDRPEFFMPEIINTGFAHARSEWVFILGCDMILKPDFMEFVMAAMKDRHYVDFDTGKKPNGLPLSKVGYYGAFGVQRSVFHEVGGYDEDLKGYGYADTDFKTRMHEHGVQRVTIPESCADHIDHDKDDRVRFYSEKAGNTSFERNVQISQKKAEKRRARKGL